MTIGECSVYSKLQAVGGLKGQVCSLAYKLAATSILDAVRVSTKVVDHPVMNIVWKVEQGPVSNALLKSRAINATKESPPQCAP